MQFSEVALETQVRQVGPILLYSAKYIFPLPLDSSRYNDCTLGYSAVLHCRVQRRAACRAHVGCMTPVEKSAGVGADTGKSVGRNGTECAALCCRYSIYRDVAIVRLQYIVSLPSIPLKL